MAQFQRNMALNQWLRVGLLIALSILMSKIKWISAFFLVTIFLIPMTWANDALETTVPVNPPPPRTLLKKVKDHFSYTQISTTFDVQQLKCRIADALLENLGPRSFDDKIKEIEMRLESLKPIADKFSLPFFPGVFDIEFFIENGLFDPASLVKLVCGIPIGTSYK